MLSKTVQNAALLLNRITFDPGITVKSIAVAHGLSTNYMENIGVKLKKHGIVTAKKGPGGGYRLVNKDVTVLDLLTIFSRKKVQAETPLNNEVREALATIKVIK